MNKLVSKGLGEQEALARLAIKAPRRFKRRVGSLCDMPVAAQM